jgi:predicted acetyltransferase
MKYNQQEFWCVDGNNYFGRIQYRKVLNANLEKYGGNIGYEVVPSARRRGVALFMLQEVIKKAKADGLLQVLVTCDSNNFASIGVVEKSNGVYIDSVDDTSSASGVTNRYLIDLID